MTASFRIAGIILENNDILISGLTLNHWVRSSHAALSSQDEQGSSLQVAGLTAPTILSATSGKTSQSWSHKNWTHRRTVHRPVLNEKNQDALRSLLLCYNNSWIRQHCFICFRMESPQSAGTFAVSCFHQSLNLGRIQITPQVRLTSLKAVDVLYLWKSHSTSQNQWILEYLV